MVIFCCYLLARVQMNKKALGPGLGLKMRRIPKSHIQKCTYARCLWRIVISPMNLQDSPSCYDSAVGNLVVLFILWFAKVSALTQDGAVFGRVVLLRLSPRQSKKTLGATTEFAWSAHI